MWQGLYEELAGRSFVVLSVAMDSREGSEIPWIEAAKPTYPVLIDREHRLADLYHLVNVPQAVWIDEAGRIVRPAESAGAYEGFRTMNRQTREMPEDAAQLTARTKMAYVDAIRDWVLHGPESAYALDHRHARERIAVPTEDSARAQAMFRLGQHLIRAGRAAEGDRCLETASRLHPESWCIWRQRAGVNEVGLAALPDFWQRVDALGDRRYYARIDMPGMP